MKIAERYSTARNTSNLKSEARTTASDSDVIGAAGLAAQQHEAAMLLWEITFKGKTQAKNALVKIMAHELTYWMAKRRMIGTPTLIAQEVLAWHLHGTCQPCGGRKYLTAPGTPMLTDKICPQCYGTGKVDFPRSDAHLWLRDKLEGWTSIAGGRVMKKLASDMEP